MSLPIYFLIIAEIFKTDSFAISPSFPVAMTLPSDSDPDGVTSATIGRTRPENSLIDGSAECTARPFTIPISDPVILKDL